eukprot:3029855-Rhodomonas_salina.1
MSVPGSTSQARRQMAYASPGSSPRRGSSRECSRSRCSECSRLASSERSPLACAERSPSACGAECSLLACAECSPLARTLSSASRVALWTW